MSGAKDHKQYQKGKLQMHRQVLWAPAGAMRLAGGLVARSSLWREGTGWSMKGMEHERGGVSFELFQMGSVLSIGSAQGR